MEELNSRKLLSLYNCLYKETDEIYRILARHYGLSDCAFWILYTLRESELPHTQSELCNLLFLSKQTVNSSLKALESQGYLTLMPFPENRRNKQVSLTDKGIALMEQTIDKVLEAEEKAFGHFTATERHSFLMLLQKHNACLKTETEKLL